MVEFITAVVSAVLSCAASIITCTIKNSSQHNKTIGIIEYKIDELTKRVDKHNNVVERTYLLEKTSEIQAEKIKVANQKIEDLERKEKDS